MNKKIILILLGVVLLIIIVGGLIYFSKKPINNKSQTFHNPEGSEANLLETGKVVFVRVGLDGVTPSTININKGEAISFMNTTNREVELKLSGALNTLIKIPAGKSQMSPIFTINGKSKFVNTENSKITGEIIIGGGDVTPTSAAPAPVFVSKGIITITDNGATPSRADVEVGQFLKITNKTNKDVTLTMTGLVNKKILIPAGKTVNSDIFKDAGKIKAVASNNENVFCIVEVK